jgi:hypothetical protein
MLPVVEDLIRMHIPEATAHQIAEIQKDYRMIARVTCEANVRAISDLLSGLSSFDGDVEKT